MIYFFEKTVGGGDFVCGDSPKAQHPAGACRLIDHQNGKFTVENFQTGKPLIKGQLPTAIAKNTAGDLYASEAEFLAAIDSFFVKASAGGGATSHAALTNRDVAGNHTKLIPTNNSTSAVQVTKADGTTPVANFDTTNRTVMVGDVPAVIPSISGIKFASKRDTGFNMLAAIANSVAGVGAGYAAGFRGYSTTTGTNGAENTKLGTFGFVVDDRNHDTRKSRFYIETLYNGTDVYPLSVEDGTAGNPEGSFVARALGSGDIVLQTDGNTTPVTRLRVKENGDVEVAGLANNIGRCIEVTNTGVLVAGNVSNRQYGYRAFTDCFHTVEGGFFSANSGTGSIATQSDTQSDNIAKGVIELKCGTSVTGNACVSTGKSFNLAQDILTYECGFKLANLPDATEGFTFMAGLNENNQQNGLDAVLINVEYSGGSAKFRLSARKDGTETKIDATNAPALSEGQWYKVKIVCTVSTATYYLATYGGTFVDVGSININIPNATADIMRAVCMIRKSLGSTDRIAYIDYVECEASYSSTNYR